MTRSLRSLRPSAFRRPVFGQCSPRCSSTFAPRTIAALLTKSAQQPASLSGETQSLILNGFVRTVRKQKRVAFAAVGDGSSLQTVQVVLSPELASGSVVDATTTRIDIL
jgi:asparaginyl-tRNA synthetase